jgi:hypothetical protein
VELVNLTEQQVLELQAIYENDTVQPVTPHQHAVVNELFDLGLLYIVPRGRDSKYGCMPEVELWLDSLKPRRVDAAE